MLAEIYKIIYNSYCTYKKFKVRKLISTRYDLNQPKYQALTPRLDIYDKQYTYDPIYYNFLNGNYVATLPTDDELRRVQQYKNMIPDYKITTEEENMKAGIVIDDPNITNFYQFEDAQLNDAVLEQNQMNNGVFDPNIMYMNTNENQKINSEVLNLQKNN